MPILFTPDFFEAIVEGLADVLVMLKVLEGALPLDWLAQRGRCWESDRRVQRRSGLLCSFRYQSAKFENPREQRFPVC
jgi:hypothetical protein